MLTGFRFRREINVLPWLKFNFSKTGMSTTVGPDAVHVTLGSHGTYVYADMPGKGTYFRRKLGPLMEDIRDDSEEDTGAHDSEAEEENGEIIDRNFLQWLVSYPSENAFVSAVNALHEQDIEEAYAKAREAASEADNAYLAGFLAVKHNDWQLAVDYFERALKNSDHLGELFAKYEVEIQVFLPVAEEFVTAIRPNSRDCLLAIAIAHERMNHASLAIKVLQVIRERYDPDDLIVRLLLAELLDEVYPNHPHVQHEIVILAEGVENESPLHAALIYYRGRALRRLKLLSAARDTLTRALKKKKDYPSDLLAALRYERALVYEAEGQDKRAHEEFEKIYAVAPELEDVAERLGLAPKINQPITTGPLRDSTPSEVVPETSAVGSSAEYEIKEADRG